jgi:O-antigen/teichoic acid export membrane protein
VHTREQSSGTQSYRRELLSNQLWQSLNFGSKAAFLLLITPMMISRWGSLRYGLFALASSLLVSMALLDGGIRSLTRIQMADAWRRGDTESLQRSYTEGILTFASVSIAAVTISEALSLCGCLTAWFHLPAGGSGVLVLTVFCTAILMTSILMLEPLAAKGNLSTLKAANTWGAMAAIPVCAFLVFLGAGVGPVILTYAACMTLPNLIVAWSEGLFALLPWSELQRFRPGIALRTLHRGFWYYLTTVSLIGKTHALTFLVSAIAGPAEAGIFYILLRFSEIISNVASTSSETSLAVLTADTNERERHDDFLQSWLHVAFFSITGALMFLFLTDQLLRFWVHGEVSIPSHVGVGLALFGLSGAFSRVVVNTSMGLNLTRPGALAGFAEALIGMIGAFVGYRVGGLSGLLLGGSMGFLCLLPITSLISQRCGFHNVGSWLRSLVPLLPGFLLTGTLFYFASQFHQVSIYLVAILLVGAISFWQLKVIQNRITRRFSESP